VQAETTSTEYLDWMKYLEQDVNDFHRQDYYFAALIMWFRKAFFKNSEDLTIKDNLIKFVNEPPSKPQTFGEKCKAAKRFFLGKLGVK